MGGIASPRLEALDVLRGLAVAGMILVVSPGDWEYAYGQLQHATWNGATLADMVFPTFLFCVGVALGLSFPRLMADAAAYNRFWTRLVRRTITLILLGLLVEATYVWGISWGAPWTGAGGLAHVRIPGILQRIGLCYLLAGVLLVATGRRDEGGVVHIRASAILAVIGLILVGYWALLRFVPVPGYGAGRLDPVSSLPAYIDRTVFTVPHLWPLGSAAAHPPATYDPEGLLPTLTATTNVLFGALAAWVWRRSRDGAVARIAVAGAVLVAAGLLLDTYFPINKRIWTSSFALFSGGVSAIALALLALVLRWDAASKLMTPMRVLGGNAILAFLLSTLMSRIGGFPLVPEAGQRILPQHWGFEMTLAVLKEPHLASLACALGVLAIVTIAIWPLHRRGIHLRL